MIPSPTMLRLIQIATAIGKSTNHSQSLRRFSPALHHFFDLDCQELFLRVQKRAWGFRLTEMHCPLLLKITMSPTDFRLRVPLGQ